MTVTGWRTILLAVSVPWTGCAAPDGDPGGGTELSQATGSVGFRLDLPGGEAVQAVELEMTCEDLTQTHVLNVVQSAAIAAFGGLAPGVCTANVSATTVGGADCTATVEFDVVGGEKADVPITLVCQGVNDNSTELQPCYGELIQRAYPTTPNVFIGTNNRVEVETRPGALSGSATYTFMLRNRDADGRAVLHGAGFCEVDSAACRNLTCIGEGPTPYVDPVTRLTAGEVWVQVVVADEACFDIGELRIQCLKPAVCGNGVAEGEEECDDANDDSSDGCADCVNVRAE